MPSHGHELGFFTTASNDHEKWRHKLKQHFPEAWACLIEVDTEIDYQAEFDRVRKKYYKNLNPKEIVLFDAAKEGDVKTLTQCIVQYDKIDWRQLRQADGKTLIDCASENRCQPILDCLFATPNEDEMEPLSRHQELTLYNQHRMLIINFLQPGSPYQSLSTYIEILQHASIYHFQEILNALFEKLTQCHNDQTMRNDKIWVKGYRNLMLGQRGQLILTLNAAAIYCNQLSYIQELADSEPAWLLTESILPALTDFPSPCTLASQECLNILFSTAEKLCNDEGYVFIPLDDEGSNYIKLSLFQCMMLFKQRERVIAYCQIHDGEPKLNAEIARFYHILRTYQITQNKSLPVNKLIAPYIDTCQQKYAAPNLEGRQTPSLGR